MQSKRRAPAACEARYVLLLRGLAGAQDGTQVAAENISGAALAQPVASTSPAQDHAASAVSACLLAPQPAPRQAPDIPAPEQMAARPRQLWETVGSLSKASAEQHLGWSIRAAGAGTLAAAVEAAMAAEPEAERVLPRPPQPSAAQLASGMQVGKRLACCRHTTVHYLLSVCVQSGVGHIVATEINRESLLWTQAVQSASGAANTTDTLDVGPVSLASAEAVLAAVARAAGPAASVMMRSIGSVARATRHGGIKARACCSSNISHSDARQALV